MMWPESAPAPEEIYDLLYQLGLPASSSAFFHLAYAVRLAACQPQRLLRPAWLYPEIARHYRTAAQTVERNVQTLSASAWKRAPDKLSRLAGTALDGAPPPVRFLSILAASLRQNTAA